MAEDTGNGEGESGGESQPPPTPQRSTVTYNPSAGSRTILGLMAFAVTFALVGHEVKNAQGNQTTSPTQNPLAGGVRIILGGFIGSGLLIMLSKAGDPGRKFAVGTATVVVLTSTVVYGAPVWKLVNSIFGSKPTTPLGGSTGSAAGTGNTTGTGSTTRTLGTTSTTGTVST